MRVLVVTVVHHPADARIFSREIQALVGAGHQVTYAAPFDATGSPPPAGLRTIDLPRAQGRRRARALARARQAIHDEAPDHDLVVVHDPELLLVAGAAGSTPVVWDVHEDLRASLVDKTWLPGAGRASLGAAVSWAERRAERRTHLLLAEDRYQDRFARPHPVVPNEPVVPATVSPSAPGRAVYIGRLSAGRGVHEMIDAARLLDDGIRVDLYGWAEPECTEALQAADSSGVLRWHGRTPNDVALDAVTGATAGLSLLRDLPNYRHSRPTKVVEYMSRGIPVVTTPSPVAREIVERHDCGMVVPFDDPAAAAEAIGLLHRSPDLRERFARNGHRAALAHYDWRSAAPRFVATLERWAATPS